MQIGSPTRVSGDPFAAMFTPEFLNPPAVGAAPAPVTAHGSNSDLLPGGHGLGGLVNGLFESAFGGGSSQNLTGAVGALGDFDPFQYVESSLAKMQNGRGSSVEAGSSGGLGQAIGSIARLIGIGG